MELPYECLQLCDSIKGIVSSQMGKEYKHQKNNEAVKTEINWDASRFWAQIIHKSEHFDSVLTYDQYIQFKNDYEHRNSITINEQDLFAKYWLRNILGFVEMSSAVKSACSDFDNVKDIKNELEFKLFLFDYVTEQKIKTIDITKFDEILGDYNKNNNLSIEKAVFFDKHWLHLKDNTIDLTNTNFDYYRPFIKYWDDFLFLTELNKKLCQRNKLRISQTNFDQIYSKFRSFYGDKLPSVDELISQAIISTNESFYKIDFYHSRIAYRDVFDNISKHYWELLINDLSFSSDKERLFEFLSKIFVWEHFSDPILNSCDESKKRFLNAAFELVKDEKEFEGVEKEFRKICIDENISASGLYFLFHYTKVEHKYRLNNADFFELYESIDLWCEKSHSNLLEIQESRNKLFFLIGLIVTYDLETERIETEDEDYPEIYHFKRIFGLLKNAKNKPSLVWKIAEYIREQRVKVVPYLLMDKDFASLSFQIIDGIDFQKENRDDVLLKLWIKCVELVFFTIRNIEDKSEAAKIIFQIYRQLNIDKYKIPYNRNLSKEEIQNRRNIERKELSVLDAIENCLLHTNNVFRKSEGYLLPTLFNELVEQFVNFEIKLLHDNGFVQFPLLKWDGYTWLLKCSTLWKYKQQFDSFTPNTLKIIQPFYETYKSYYAVTKTKRFSYIEKKDLEEYPFWGEKIERLEFIDWVYLVLFLDKEGKLDRFLSPEIDFERTQEYYHKGNDFNSYKLRTHIGVLLQVIRKLGLPAIPYGFDKKSITSIKGRIESQIIQYIRGYTLDNLQDGKIDLFSHSKETKFNNSEKEALFPQLARAFNWFDSKDEIIDAIVSTNDVQKIFTLADKIASTGIRKKLISKIKQSDIQAFLQNASWSVLLKIRKYPELSEKIQEVVRFWEENLIRKESHDEERLFHTKLILAYFKCDEFELNRVKQPKDKRYSFGELSNQEYIQFYRALIRLKTKPSDAYEILNQLSNKYFKNSDYATYRMAAKIQIANETGETNVYREAIEEWNEYKTKNQEINETSLGSIFTANKMLILLNLNEFEELNTSYQSLDLLDRMYPDILNCKIKSLIEQNCLDEANQLLEEAQRFHQTGDNKEIDFIKKLKLLVDRKENYDVLEICYNRIFNLNPTSLIKVLPNKINGRKSLNEFLTKEIAHAANKMLEKIMSISDIADENKYNDIIQLVLDARISPWGWQVGDQSRGGFSNPKSKNPKQPGERDLPIKDSNSTPICICEAFIFRKPSIAKDHIAKVFNYYPQKDNIVLLVYNLKQNGEFESNCDKYFDEIIPTTVYPIGYEYVDKRDVTLDFEYQKSAIKIFKSIHNGGVEIYHVYVNIDYKV